MSNNAFVTVRGKRFHYSWLRDRCLSNQSRHPDSWEKLVYLSDCTSPPEPLSVVEEDEKLIIEWNEKPSHRSIFPISWLMRHAYDAQPQSSSENVLLWDKAYLESKPVEKLDAYSTNTQLWISQFLSLGFVILKNIKTENLDSFLSSIGPIRDTEYGRIVTATVGKGLSSTVKALPPHNDLTYCSGHRLVQFIYCAENHATGGESLVVDGFRVAQQFRQDYPEYFQILVETPLNFWRVQQEHQYFFNSKQTIIELDRENNFTAIRFSQKNCMPNLPFEKVESFYQAYTAFSRYMNNLDYRYCFRLQPGECLLMQNFRILHGRSAFDPNSGSREMRVGYVDWDYFLGRYFYEQEFNPNPNTVSLN
jgi:alpha-ketoglutarate-dependent taurine dioxygenase